MNGNVDLVGAEVLNLLERRELNVILCDDPFAGSAMGNAMFLAKGVELLLARDTEFGLQRVGAVIDAGMDHFAVPGGDFCAYGIVAL